MIYLLQSISHSQNRHTQTHSAVDYASPVLSHSPSISGNIDNILDSPAVPTAYGRDRAISSAAVLRTGPPTMPERRRHMVCGSQSLRWPVGRLCPVCSKSSCFRCIANLCNSRTFRIFYNRESAISCSAFRLDRQTSKQGEVDTYGPGNTMALFLWVDQTILKALAQR